MPKRREAVSYFMCISLLSYCLKKFMLLVKTQ